MKPSCSYAFPMVFLCEVLEIQRFPRSTVVLLRRWTAGIAGTAGTERQKWFRHLAMEPWTGPESQANLYVSYYGPLF